MTLLLVMPPMYPLGAVWHVAFCLGLQPWSASAAMKLETAQGGSAAGRSLQGPLTVRDVCSSPTYRRRRLFLSCKASEARPVLLQGRLGLQGHLSRHLLQHGCAEMSAHVIQGCSASHVFRHGSVDADCVTAACAACSSVRRAHLSLAPQDLPEHIRRSYLGPQPTQ